MSAYNLLFATDQNYLPYLFTTCQSILNSLADSETNSQDQLVFHVLVDASVAEHVAMAYVDSFTEFNAPAKVSFSFALHKIDATTLQSFERMSRGSWSTISPYFRLLFAQVIPQDIPQILYMDIDLLILADIRQLFAQYPLNESVMYVATTPRAILRVQKPFDPEPCLELPAKQPDVPSLKIPVKDCIGSGVMLINLEQWRLQNIEQQCLDIGQKWLTPLFDQDILSAACLGKISHMDWGWNTQFSLFKLLEITGWNIEGRLVPYAKLPLSEQAPSWQEFQDLMAHPKIVHFTEIKPWALPLHISPQEYEWLKGQIPYLLQWVDLRKSLQPMFNKIDQRLGLNQGSGYTLAVFDQCYTQTPRLLLSPPAPALAITDGCYATSNLAVDGTEVDGKGTANAVAAADANANAEANTEM